MANKKRTSPRVATKTLTTFSSKFQLYESKEEIEYLEIFSVQLVRLGAENLPGGIASGLLIAYKSKRYLCTAAHCLAKGPLSLQLEWSNTHRATKTRLVNLQPIFRKTVLKPENLEANGVEELDFAFCEINFDDVTVAPGTG